MNPQIQFDTIQKKRKSELAAPSRQEPRPPKLERPEKLTFATKDNLHRQKKEKWGIHEGLVRRQAGCLDIHVSPQNIDRALLLMDTLIKRFQDSPKIKKPLFK